MIQRLRTLALTLIGGLVLITVAIHFVLGYREDAFAVPETWALAAVLGVGVATHVVIFSIGYRAPAIDPTAPRESYVAGYQSAMILRFALGESTAILALALGFVVPEGGMLLFLIGVAIAFAALALHVYPWEFSVERYRAALEREGGTSYLREDLGLEQPPTP